MKATSPETCPPNWEQTLCTIILHAGNARSAAKEAGELAAAGHWEEAEGALQKAEEEQLAAHKMQAEILHKEARGEMVPFSILLVHALDLLLLAWAEIDYAQQFLTLYRRLEALQREAQK